MSTAVLQRSVNYLSSVISGPISDAEEWTATTVVHQLIDIVCNAVMFVVRLI